MVRWPNRGTRNLSTAIRRISIEYKWQNFVSGAGVHISCHAAWQEWTSRTVSGATRNHPTFATKRATLIFPPPWICCEERVIEQFRGQFVRKHVYDKSFGIIGRTVEDRRWNMSARKRYGEPLNYISSYECLNTIIRKLSIEKQVLRWVGNSWDFFTRKTLWNSSSNEILLN